MMTTTRSTRRFAILAACFATVLATGCATKPQMPIALDKAVLEPSRPTIAVVSAVTPPVDVRFPGASCLLCVGVAIAMHSDLNTHVRSLPLEDLGRIKDLVAQAAGRRGAKVKVIESPLDMSQVEPVRTDDDARARYDLSWFAKEHGVERVLVVNLREVGVERPFSSYVPVAPPRAVVRGEAFLVDVRSGRYEWYLPLDVTRAVSGEWSESPKFPGLTNAYHEALEVAKDAILAAF